MPISTVGTLSTVAKVMLGFESSAWGNTGVTPTSIMLSHAVASPALEAKQAPTAVWSAEMEATFLAQRARMA